MAAIGTLLLIAAISYVFWWILLGLSGQAQATDPEIPLFLSDTDDIMTEFHRIRGLEKRNPDGRERLDLLGGCLIGDDLRLVEEPAGPNEASSLNVIRADGEQLGDLNGPQSAALRESLLKGLRVEAVLSAIRGSVHTRFGVQAVIKVTREVANPIPWEGGYPEGDPAGRRGRGRHGPTALWV